MALRLGHVGTKRPADRLPAGTAAGSGCRSSCRSEPCEPCFGLQPLPQPSVLPQVAGSGQQAFVESRGPSVAHRALGLKNKSFMPANRSRTGVRRHPCARAASGLPASRIGRAGDKHFHRAAGCGQDAVQLLSPSTLEETRLSPKRAPQLVRKSKEIRAMICVGKSRPRAFFAGLGSTPPTGKKN